MIKKYFVLFLVLFVANASATNFGKVSGKIVDKETGEPLVGANVVIEGQSLGAATDENGEYIVLLVPPGSYDVRVEYIGFQPVVIKGVEVRANRISYADAKISPTVLQGEETVVVAERPLIEKDNTATLRSVSSHDIENIPAVTVTDILSTQPGVVNTGGLHFRGGRSGETTYFLDGIPVVNPLFSDINSSEVINQNAISEMQVISGTYSAEYGNAMSGIINITTREGGNNLQGKVDIKSSGMGFGQASQDYNRRLIRANVGGPLLSQRTNFFLTGSLDNRDNYLPWGFRNEKNIFAKITDRHIRNFKFSVGANLSQGDHKNYSHSWKYIPGQYWYEPRTNSQLVQLGVTQTLRNNLYYTLNLYYNAYHYDSGDYNYNDLSPAYQLDANKEFYLQSFVSSYEKDNQKTYGIKGDVLWQANNYNEFKAGVEFRQHNIERFYISSPYYDDHVLDDYNRKPREAAAYVQDKINFSSIILSAGLRFDLTDPNSGYWPNPFDAYYNNDVAYKKAQVHSQLSPRLGISYPVSEKTVFHFGYGSYFQRPEYQFIYKSISDANYKENIIMNLRTGNGRFGNPDLKPEKTIAYEFGVSHQLFSDYILNVSVYSKRIKDYVGTRTFFAGDRPEYWETFTLHINEDFAYNNGLELQFRKIRGKYFYGELNYTYSIAEGSSSGPLERVGIEEANRQSLKFFPLEFDQRHTINANMNLRFGQNEGPNLGFAGHILENFRFSMLFQYGSGLPYTKGIRGATEPYEINNARLPENWTLDLKVNRTVNIGSVTVVPYLEIFNLTNRRNVLYVDPFTGRPDFSFGRTYEYAANPLNWGAPRIMYFGFEIKN